MEVASVDLDVDLAAAVGLEPLPCQVVRFHFEREVDRTQRAVHIALFVSGWITKPEEFTLPWEAAAKRFFPNSGHLALKWEPEPLDKLSHLVREMITRTVAAEASSVWWKATVGSAVTAGGIAALAVMWPVTLISTMYNLDNAWLVMVERSQQAGTCLAHVLADKQGVGQRPVTLVGHSMGARVIFHCLLELYQMGEFNVVDEVVLMGAPVTSRPLQWERARAVVTGQLVNCYLRKDWILALLYRYLEWGLTVAGLSAVDVPGVRNVNLAGLGIQGHADYPNHILDILTLVQMGDRHPQ